MFKILNIGNIQRTLSSNGSSITDFEQETESTFLKVIFLYISFS